MKSFVLFISFTCNILLSNAQTSTDTNTVKWRYGGFFSLGLAQGGTRNWSPGGDRFSLALNGFLSIAANREYKKWNWDNLAELNYGVVNTNSTGIIKNDDKIDLNSRLSFNINSRQKEHWRLGGHVNFRTQFADGFDYDNTPKKRISAFSGSCNICFFARLRILLF